VRMLMRGGSIFFPLLMIAMGVIFLLRNLFPDFYWLLELHRFWPVLLILWGVAMLGRRAGWRNL
jgi:hypothetical protein